MFPELGERVIEAGNEKIRIKYCPSPYTSRYYGSKEHSRYFSCSRYLVDEINGLSKPEYLCSTCKKVAEKRRQ
jgi:hypothetical protein